MVGLQRLIHRRSRRLQAYSLRSLVAMVQWEVWSTLICIAQCPTHFQKIVVLRICIRIVIYIYPGHTDRILKNRTTLSWVPNLYLCLWLIYSGICSSHWKKIRVHFIVRLGWINRKFCSPSALCTSVRKLIIIKKIRQ